MRLHGHHVVPPSGSHSMSVGLRRAAPNSFFWLKKAIQDLDLDLDFSDREYSILSDRRSTEGEEESCKNEREEIRKRLAMSADEEFGFGTDDDSVGASETLSPRKQRLQARLQGAPNGMQICFMNDDVLDYDEDDEANDAGDVQTSADEGEANQTESAIPPPNHPCFPGEIQEFTNRQTQLQSEATLALAQASTMARMQLEVEKQGKKKSPVADMVGIPTLGQGRRLRLNRGKLQEMNIAQLQVLVNDLHSQIELLNEDLVHLLIERDDLHMEQDSMLVDIEDLTSHCHDPKATNNNKSTQNNNRPANRRDRHK